MIGEAAHNDSGGLHDDGRPTITSESQLLCYTCVYIYIYIYICVASYNTMYTNMF